jgi:hypothetical protein
MTSSPLGWKVTGASVTGTSHLRSGRVCDDAHACYIYEHDLLCIAVADGAGSARHASLGATTAVQAAIDETRHLLIEQNEPDTIDQWLSVLRQICTLTRDALVQRAQAASMLTESALSSWSPEQEVTLRDFATTFLLAIAHAHWVAIAQIGDGAIVIQHLDGSLTSLTPPYQGEYINETSFLTDTAYLDLANFTVLPCADINGLALLTDGLELLAMNFPVNTPHQPFFTPLFTFAGKPEASSEELERFLTSERVCARTDDDKTLVLAVYR